MARFVDMKEDEWDRLIDDKLRTIYPDDDSVPDKLPDDIDTQLKYSILHKHEVDKCDESDKE